MGGCSSDLLGPSGGLVVQAVQPTAGAALSGAPGRALPQTVVFRALDATDQPVAGARVQWTVTGYGGRVANAAAVTGADGTFAAEWVLGTRASEVQRLRADVRLPGHWGREGFIELRAAAVPVEVVSIMVAPETTAVLLGTSRVLRAVATDPFGNRFAPAGARFYSVDTAVVTVDSLGTVQSRQGGFASVAVAASGVVGAGVVRVVAVVRAIGVDHDTLTFRSLGQIDSLKAWVVDSQGLVIRGLLPSVLLTDSSVARVHAGFPFTVTALRNGSTTMQLQGESVIRQVVIVVQQQPASIQAVFATQNPILTGAIGSPVALQCRVLDGTGHEMALQPTLTVSGSGVLAGSRCSDVQVRHSGLDTLRLAVGAVVATVPVAVAVPPVVSSAVGDLLQVDSLPEGEPWAPSVRRNSRGQMEVYFGLMGEDYEDLHRLVSADGIAFRYDGMVLQHDPHDCSLTGFGFENVAVVPRQEAAGWRMLVSGGHFDCYGWQVFSAVSTDERNWTLESGVRLPNNQSGVPDRTIPPPYWPTGEGMVVDRLPSGGWRMLVGAYEHLNPYEDRFQIIEWDSPDQLTWTYIGPVLTTRQMPAAGAGNVYCPTIRQIAPGLWRMIFTADNRPQAEWRSGLWSAVSTDLEHWQVEGQLLGSAATNLFYAALLDDRLVFIRQDVGDSHRYLAIATVTMN